MILATLRNKKLYKIVTIVVSLIFLGSIVAVALVSGGTASAAASSNIGIVDYQKVVTSSPSFQAYTDQMQVEEAKTKQDFDQNSAKMSDKEKEAYFNQLKQWLQTKQQDLLKGVIDKVNAIIKTVAEDKGLSAVLDKNQVFYGGTDITDDVMKKITGK